MGFKTVSEIIDQLSARGDGATKAVLLKHGAKEPCLGVKIDAIKSILKQTERHHDLAMGLFESKIFDAMYMAGLLMDGSTMSRTELDAWAQTNYGSSISSYTVPWVASESPHGYGLAQEWIKSPHEFVAVAGWETLAALASVKADSGLDLAGYGRFLDDIPTAITSAKNRVKQAMNNFVISVGIYVAPLQGEALRIADALGTVRVDQGDTACRIPPAREYIEKAIARGKAGQKKKTAKC